MNTESDVRSLEQLSVAELEAGLIRETKKYRRGQPSDSRYGLELFRRALSLSPSSSSGVRPSFADEPACEAIVRIYSDFIRANINRSAMNAVSLDDVIQQVWLRFWQAAGRGLSFYTLEAALSYLKRVTVSVLIEELRRSPGHARETSLQKLIEEAEPLQEDPASDPMANVINQRFQERCREVLTDPLEQQIFWMRYFSNLPPRQIAHQLAAAGIQLDNRTITARTVSDLLERVFQRLSNDLELRDLLQAD